MAVCNYITNKIGKVSNDRGRKFVVWSQLAFMWMMATIGVSLWSILRDAYNEHKCLIVIKMKQINIAIPHLVVY